MSFNRDKSTLLFKESQEIFPGGVNSPVRAFSSVGGEPIFIDRASGPYIYDVDGNKFIDYVGSWGPAIVGHAHPEVIKEVSKTIERGFSFGAPCPLETRLAKKIRSFLPSIEMMRFVSSGTEACMSALRLARGYTGRDKILKFEGCYHGHGDMLLVKAGSGLATLGIPGSPGVPEGAVRDTLVVPYNNIEAVERVFETHGNELAAVILEPIVGNANFIRPSETFIQVLRELCDGKKTLLIFDEVMTGFRVHPNSAQCLFDITPDLTCLGKVVGGGMPVGVYGGREEIVRSVAPVGSVYQAGTLSGNPVAMACGMKTLELLENQCSFWDLSQKTKRLTQGMVQAAKKASITMSADCEGGMFGISFSNIMPKSFEDAKNADVDMFARFFRLMLDRGIYLAPSAFEAGFVSFTHSDMDIDRTIEAAEEVCKDLRG